MEEEEDEVVGEKQRRCATEWGQERDETCKWDGGLPVAV